MVENGLENTSMLVVSSKMVVLRSGKSTNPDDARIHECGHVCCLLKRRACCGCSDTRRVRSSYVVYNKCYPTKVGRDYRYCQTCKKTPSVVKFDISEDSVETVTVPVIFHPTLEFKLSETEKKLAIADKRIITLEAELDILMDMYGAEVDEWKEQYRMALATINTLRSRLR